MALPREIGQLNPGEQLKLHLTPTSRVLLLPIILTILFALTILLIPLAVIFALVTVWVYFSQVKARHYFVTNQRIVLTRRFGSKDRRDLYFQNISDFVVDQGIGGRIFGYGAILPVTLGTLVQDDATSRSRKRKTNPRSLYRMGGIGSPHEVYNTIQPLRQATATAPSSSPITREIIREVVLIQCPNCRARYPQGTTKCLTCGATL